MSAILLTCVGFGKRGELEWVAASMWVSPGGWQNSAWELYVYLEAKKRNKHFRIPNNMHTRLDSSNCRKSCFTNFCVSNFCVCALEINLHLCQKQWCTTSPSLFQQINVANKSAENGKQKYCSCQCFGKIEGSRFSRSCFHPDWPLGYLKLTEEAHNSQAKYPQEQRFPIQLCFLPVYTLVWRIHCSFSAWYLLSWSLLSMNLILGKKHVY